MKTEYEDGLRTVYQINAVSEMTLHFYGGYNIQSFFEITSGQLLKMDSLFLHGNFDNLIPVTRQLFFRSKKRMVDGKTDDLTNFIKSQLEVVRAIFFYPYP